MSMHWFQKMQWFKKIVFSILNITHIPNGSVIYHLMWKSLSFLKWYQYARQCTEVHFASFLSGRFITAIVVNPPEKKLAKHTSMQCTAMWCHIDKNHKYKTNLISSLPIWSTSSVNEVKNFDCWTPSIRIRVSWANSYRWKRQFFYWIGQCLKYCNNGAAIPC